MPEAEPSAGQKGGPISDESAPKPRTYYVYVLECEDGSLYSGITTDVVRRLREHLSQRPPGARYTQRHRPVGLRGLWDCEGRSLACRLEWRLHHASRSQKLELLAAPELAGGGWEPVGEEERLVLWEEAVVPTGA
ncbi:GIY-YIG nuclease family protein [Olsenella phocaeensis]|uniref:GIY-YIG nuclease family protein n=1 Tax=Olsenella phocaeensis TaxID=1852385 RepID=UPI003A8D6F1C